MKDIGKMGNKVDKADISLELTAATALESTLKVIFVDKEFFVGKTEESMKENSRIVKDTDMALNTTRKEK